MRCGSIPSARGLGLIQRGFKEMESHDHTSWCSSFISAGSIHHAEPRAAHLTRDTLMEPLGSAHTRTAPNKPSRAVLSSSPPPPSAENHPGTRLGDTRGFAEPLKAPGHSFFDGNVTIGRAEPPLTARPGLCRCPSLDFVCFPTAWLTQLLHCPRGHRQGPGQGPATLLSSWGQRRVWRGALPVPSLGLILPQSAR